MHISLVVIIAALVLTTTSCVTSQQQKVNHDGTVTFVTKYDRMDKQHLKEELERLQKELSEAEQAHKQAAIVHMNARNAYKSATEEQKPDALFHMLETEVKEKKLSEKYSQISGEFFSARRSYNNLLYAEEK